MLTIKHVERGGEESIIVAQSVRFNPESSALEVFGAEVDNGGAFHDGHGRYGDGTVYVMNHNGATVAKYNLA